MDLKLDEQLLVAEFRRLDPAGKRELMDHAAMLVKKYRGEGEEQSVESAHQCRLDPPDEERPEAVKEPIFTE
jgi:hypothetical protein